jgi:DNA-binding transcriptional MocR family regulator
MKREIIMLKSEISKLPFQPSHKADAIPANPLRALFPFAARDGMLSQQGIDIAVRVAANPGILFEQAVAQNVLFASSISFSADLSNPANANHIRLCFAAQDSARIRQGCDRLGRALAHRFVRQRHV